MSTTSTDHSFASDRHPSRRAVLRSLVTGAASAAFLAAGWSVQAAPQANRETGSAPVMASPVKMVFLFGEPEDVEIFEGYYRTTHVPLALKMPNFLSLESALAFGDADGGKRSFYRIATLSFASEADMVSCVTSEAGLAAIADVANFATGGVTATIVKDIQSRSAISSAVGPSTEVTLPQRYEQRRPD